MLVEAAPDAIQLSPGSARLLQERPGPKPARVLRTDVANVYGPTVDAEAGYFSELVPEAVEQAVRLDAACVVVNLLWIDGREDLHRACVRNVGALKARCEPAWMPLMVEPLAMKPGGGLRRQRRPGTDSRARARAVELGADVIKADPTDDLGDYPSVIEVAGPIPLLVRGGSRASDEEVLQRTEAVMPGCRRDRVRPQRDPARAPVGDDAGADVGGPRRRRRRRGPREPRWLSARSGSG